MECGWTTSMYLAAPGVDAGCDVVGLDADGHVPERVEVHNLFDDEKKRTGGSANATRVLEDVFIVKSIGLTQKTFESRAT